MKEAVEPHFFLFLSFSSPSECEANKWGPTCANTCSCITSNTEKCNNVDGSCSCNPGFTGTTCSQCGPTSWGKNCANSCSCDADNTEDCDDVTGQCRCSSGYDGTDCSHNINECLNSTLNVCTDSQLCVDKDPTSDNVTYECICKCF